MPTLHLCLSQSFFVALFQNLIYRIGSATSSSFHEPRWIARINFASRWPRCTLEISDSNRSHRNRSRDHDLATSGLETLIGPVDGHLEAERAKLPIHLLEANESEEFLGTWTRPCGHKPLTSLRPILLYGYSLGSSKRKVRVKGLPRLLGAQIHPICASSRWSGE